MPLGGGLYGTTIGLSDGTSVGGWAIDITVQGVAGAEIQQVKAFGAVVVDLEADADTYDPIPSANYDKELDTWVYAPFEELAVGITEGANSYRAHVATPSDEDYGDIDVLYIVSTAGWLDYSTVGGIGHGQEFYDDIESSIPERTPVPVDWQRITDGLNEGGGGGGDPDSMDFWEFTLEAGTDFRAEIIAAEFDPVIGWFDDAGDLIIYNDNGGQGLLSKITGTVPSSGSVIIGVTGYPDFGFTASHSQSGEYTLEVIPEPATLGLLLIGGLALLRRRKSI